MALGTFSGNPKTEWLIDANGEDRDMRLLEDFTFTDPAGRAWVAPAGSVVNGASIPRPLWSSVGSPYTDDYRRASVVHDIAVATDGVVRKEADVMFLHACRAGGCTEVQARILYAGVRIGAWADTSLPWWTLSSRALLFNQPMDVPTLEEQFMLGKLTEISDELEVLPDDVEATPEELDAIIERHLHIVEE